MFGALRGTDVGLRSGWPMMIGTAVQAPSAINQQPWCFVVVREQLLLARISDQAKSHLLRASLGAPAHPFRDI